MDVAAAVDFEALLVLLVSHSILDLGTYHNLVAFHVVEHDVLQLCLQCLSIHFVKVDLVRRDHLDAHVIFYEVDGVLADVSDGLVDLELAVVGFDAVLDFEEEDVAGAADDEGFVEDEVHLSERHARLLHYCVIESVRLCVLLRDDEGFGLAVDRVDFILLLVIEAF